MPSIAQVGESWFKELTLEFDTDWFKEIRRQVGLAYESGKVVPDPKDIFKAYRLTPLDTVKVVIVGQDPYPNGDHADGLAFSSKKDTTPKSLEVIFEDLEREYGQVPTSNSLEPWAKQGVLLLNTSLTVLKGVPMSHAEIGWEKLIGATLSILKNSTGIVYLAWGRPAQILVQRYVDTSRNLILPSPHPVAQLYSKGALKFAGRFKEANTYLESQGKEQIRWI